MVCHRWVTLSTLLAALRLDTKSFSSLTWNGIHFPQRCETAELLLLCRNRGRSWAGHGIQAREMLGSRNFWSQNPISALKISSRGWLKLSVLKCWGRVILVWALNSSAHLIALFGRGECSHKLQRGFLSIPAVPSQFSPVCGQDMEPRFQGGADWDT